MPVRMTVLAALLAAGTAACDPVVTMEIRQSLVPAPPADCVVNAVSSSAHVTEVRPRREDVEVYGYWVSFRDPFETPVLTDRPAPDSSRIVTLSYLWLEVFQPDRREMRLIRTDAESVLAEVRAACAPESPASECVMTGPSGPSRPCPTV